MDSSPKGGLVERVENRSGSEKKVTKDSRDGKTIRDGCDVAKPFLG